MIANKVLNASGLLCPMPVVKATLAIEEMKSGNVLEVIADDPGAKKDFPAWCESTGHGFVKMDAVNGKYVFFIKKK